MYRRGRGIPYRGQVYPKVQKHRSPPKPTDPFYEQFFWFIVVIVGIIILGFAITLSLTGNFGGFFVFAIYLIFLLIFIFALRDAKKIKMMTPDKDDALRNPKTTEDPAVLFKDYINQIEWAHTHRKRHHPSRWSAPEPEWQYRAIKATSDKIIHDTLKTHKRLFWIILTPSVVVLAVLVALFGISSPISFVLIIIFCLAFLAVYLMRD